MIALLTTHRISGVQSSGLPFVFWLVMSLYGAFKMRTLALLAEDHVCVCVHRLLLVCILLYISAFLVETVHNIQ